MAFTPPFSPSAQPLLVGRDRERAILTHAFAATVRGQGRLVLISGEAGIGKTALAGVACMEAARQCIPSFVGRCYDLTETPPYGPWVELSATYDVTPDQPPLSSLFAPGTVTDSQSSLFVQVREALRAAATAHPFALVLDDMQWADPGSLALLRLLARDLTTYPVLFIVIYRSEELPTSPAFRNLLSALIREAQPLRLLLRPLGTDAVGVLVRERYAALPAADATQITDYIHRHAEGNPFFIGELLHGLEEDGHLTNGAGGWAIHDLDGARVPPALRHVIARRIAKFGEEAERLLAIAAVIGQDVPLSLWMAVGQVAEPALLSIVEGMVAARLMDESPTGSSVHFAHALIRETLYTGMLAARRRVLHRTIAEALTATPYPDPDAVAYHFRLAGDARAVEWLIRAGERAIAAHAPQTAAACFTDALHLIEDDGGQCVPRCELLLRLVRLLRTTNTARSIAHVQEAERLAVRANDAVLAAVARFRLGYLYGYVGDRHRGLDIQAEGVAALDALPPSAMTRVAPLDFVAASPAARHGSYALRLAEAGRFSETVRHANIALTDAAEKPEPLAYEARLALGAVDRSMGRYEEAWLSIAAPYAYYRTHNEHDVACWLAASALHGGALVCWPDDRVKLAQARAMIEARVPQPGELFAVLPIRLLLAPLLYLDGSWMELRQIGATVRRTRYADHVFAHLLPIVLAMVAVEQGDVDAAWSLVRAEFPTGAATAPGDNRIRPADALQCIAATLALDAGDRATAHAWIMAHDRRLAWSGAALGQAESALLWARYHRANGDGEAAEEQARHALALATAPRQPLVLIAAHRLLGELDTAAGRYDDADGHLDAALSLAAACGAPYERALTLLARAELRVVMGDNATALGRLEEVRAICTPLGARPALLRAERLVARLTPYQAERAAPHPAGLTEREIAVLRLLAGGSSNRAIGEALGINTRTVERRISNIYTKIGVSGRAEAATYANRHGLL